VLYMGDVFFKYSLPRFFYVRVWDRKGQGNFGKGSAFLKPLLSSLSTAKGRRKTLLSLTDIL